MARLYVQSQATAALRRFPVYLVDATDGLTPETSESAGQPQLSKNGGAWTNTTAALVAVGNGHYYVELTATELNTAGYIAVRYKSAATAEFNMDGRVIAFNLQTANVTLAAVTHTGALIPTVTTLTGHTPQTGDSFARIGATGSGLTSLASATNLTTVLNRLGALTGTGVNTLLGFFQALFRTDGTLPSDIGGTFTPTTDSLEALTDRIGVAGAGLSNIDLPNQTMDIVGNITGNLSGSVGSVTAGVTVTTNNDKTGYSLSAAAIQAIWDALTSALVTVGSVGKLLVDNINATISSRMPTTHINATTGVVDTVNLVNTTTTNTDMRGTDSAAVATALATAQADITQILSDIAALPQLADALAEPGQGAPSTTPTRDIALAYIFYALTNGLDVDTVSGFTEFYNRTRTTVLWKKANADAGGILTQGSGISGP